MKNFITEELVVYWTYPLIQPLLIEKPPEGSLYANGLSVSEIAKQLLISEKNVLLYIPYSRGQYSKDQRSNEAIRSEGYRERMKGAENSQVKKKNQNRSQYMNSGKEMENDYMRKLNVIKERDRQLDNDRPMKEWARSMGWTGRMINPKNIL